MEFSRPYHRACMASLVILLPASRSLSSKSLSIPPGTYLFCCLSRLAPGHTTVVRVMVVNMRLYYKIVTVTFMPKHLRRSRRNVLQVRVWLEGGWRESRLRGAVFAPDAHGVPVSFSIWSFAPVRRRTVSGWALPSMTASRADARNRLLHAHAVEPSLRPREAG